MSIGTSSLRITSIEQPKEIIFNGKQETALKPRRMTPHLWKMQYNRNRHHGAYGSSYMNCMYFNFYRELFTVVAIFDL